MDTPLTILILLLWFASLYLLNKLAKESLKQIHIEITKEEK